MKPEELEAAIRYLHPEAEFSFTAADFDSVKFDKIDGEAPTLEDITSALKEIKANAIAKEKAKTALLDRLGITPEEAKLLLS